MLCFFKSLLGAQGFSVLETLTKANPDLESYLSPRIIVGWLRQAEYGKFNLPSNCPISKLVKNGYGYDGVSNIGNIDYVFEHSSEEHVAAIIAIATDNIVKSVELKAVDLAKLAKTIDLLLKANKKPAAADQIGHTETAKPLEATPAEPAMPTQPKQVAKKVLKIPKVVKKEVDSEEEEEPKKLQKPLKLKKAQVTINCNVCCKKFFIKDNFEGCDCFKELAKNITTSVVNECYVLNFNQNCDTDAVLALVEIFNAR